MRIADWIDRRLAGRQRTTLSVVGLATVALVIVVAVAAAMWLRQAAIEDQRQRLDDMAAALAQHAGRTLDSVDLVLTVLTERIAAGPADPGSDPEALHRLLHDHIAGQPHIRGVIYFDAEGIGRGDSAAAPPRPIAAADREYFRHHRDTPGRGLFIDVPLLSRVSGLPTVVLSKRVPLSGGELLGVVAASLDTGTFSDFYRGLSIGGTSAVSLLRADGRTIVRHPDPGEGGAAAAVDERNAVAVERAVERYPVTVRIAMPLKAALRNWEHQAAVVAGATIAILLFVGLIGLVLLDQSERLEATVAALAAARDAAVQARLREEDAGRAKSAFLANTSHELRTPLNAILGFSEVLRDGHVGLLEPKQRGYAASIHEAGTHLLGLIGDLLDMAKIEAREIKLRESVVDLADIVAGGIKLTQRRAIERGVQVIPRTEGDPIRILGDAQRLRQIVLNLVSNAIKFTAGGGRVWIDTSLDAGGRPTLTVADTGIGMTAEEIKVALTPFRQVESALTRSHEGTGLGLPIVKALAELHGGYIKIESERGVGTRVTVSLPASRLVTDANLRAAG